MAARYVEAYRADANAMGLVTPDHEPLVSGSIDEIQALISELMEKGQAYECEGSVWFDVDRFPEYGKLSGQKVDELRTTMELCGKRASADFALWKGAKPGEPAWPSPWGDGRPGWHIECSAMSKSRLGDTLDIHGGGLDLIFPHHENEIAQSEAANGTQYTRYWMHNGMLTMDGGQKMGKSLGNVIDLHDALKAFPAESLVLYYLQNKYRSSLPWNDEALPEALGMLARLYDAREAAESMGGAEDADRVAQDLGADAKEVLALGRSFEERYYAAMDDDFNTAVALAAAFELARAINRFAGHKKARKRGGPVVAPALAAFDLLARSLGILGSSIQNFQEEVKTKRLGAMGVQRDVVEGLLVQRTEARAARDWTRADAIRDELDALHIVVMDTAEGVDWRVCLRS
jgi:cysteinyl-tRNA synthetase